MPYRNIRLRYPFEVYLLALAAFTSAPGALGKPKTSPGAIESLLEPWQVRFWTVSLCLGAILALSGIFWSVKNAKSQMTGLILEQVGLIICGFAGVIYVICIWTEIGNSGLVASGIVLGFAVAAFAQARMIHQAMSLAVSIEKIRGRRLRR